MEIDIEKIKKRISEINETIEKAEQYASVPDQEFWGDERNILSVKHLLLEAIEACGSICIHISAKKLFNVPSSFAECFENLKKSDIVNDELASRLVRMARFRNILVHRYWEVDDRKILDYARNHTVDFRDFLRSVFKYLSI
jgi:uncharacterized protein YutE (UPF0331/DUF86 family)